MLVWPGQVQIIPLVIEETKRPHVEVRDDTCSCNKCGQAQNGVYRIASEEYLPCVGQGNRGPSCEGEYITGGDG